VGWFDVLIVVIPVCLVFYMGLRTRRYLKDVTSFLSAGRVCGRYVISVADIANGVSILTLLSYVEVHYRTGYALAFWNTILMPISVMLGLYGYCSYRYRETRSQSLGEFIEIRYSRKMRVFAATLRSLTEMLVNMIMPALAARFFIYLLGIPKYFTFLGMELSSFHVLMFCMLTAAISIIFISGSLGLIVTDTIQGFICFPLMVFFIIFVLVKFSWGTEVLPMLSNRVAGESFLSPYDISKLRDFNYFMLFVAILNLFLHRASWIGGGGSSSAAKSPHEQKMAGLLGAWKGSVGTVFYLVIGLALLVYMNHADFAKPAHDIRQKLSTQVANDIIKDPALNAQVRSGIRSWSVDKMRKSVEGPMSDKANVDTRYLAGVHQDLRSAGQAKGNSLFQQFRTLYHQQMLPVAFRSMIPRGLLGLFCLLMILAMVSTDDSRIFSATVTISQDVILPFCKKDLTPKQHLCILRMVAVGIGVFFFIGSSYMSQLDYIQLYTTLIGTMWIGGCGPVMLFGLYSRFGNVYGAWTSLLTGMFMALGGTLVQRNWANFIYPWLQQHDLVTTVGTFLETVSQPLNPLVVWHMNAVKCPVNSYEWSLITQLTTLILYIVVSLCSSKERFNLDRMLHRGEYAIDGVREIKSVWNWDNLYRKLIGITPEYTFWDRVIAWCYFYYSIVYRFGITFLLVVIWNLFDPWPLALWGYYFLITFLVIPGIMVAITAVWFGICGAIDLKAMFRDLRLREANELDNGRVEGNMSIADRARFAELETRRQSEKLQN